jgi:hypothetical protein
VDSDIWIYRLLLVFRIEFSRLQTFGRKIRKTSESSKENWDKSKSVFENESIFTRFVYFSLFINIFCSFKQM